MRKINNVININNNWLYSQPNIGDEIVIFVNHPLPSYHVVKWKNNNNNNNNNDWDIYLKHNVFVGPRNFKDGSQFFHDVEDKEFYWMPKNKFINLLS